MDSYDFYLKASNYFLNPSNYDGTTPEEKEYNHFASVILSWIALESYVNAISESLALGKGIDTSKMAFLNEYEFGINDDGNVIQRKIRPPTTKKILFVMQNFSNRNVKRFRQSGLWKRIKNFENLRNEIVHHKGQRNISISLKRAQECRDTAKEVIDYMNQLLR